MLPLINKTSQSYGRSMMKPEDIVKYAKDNNIGVAALTDLHSMSAIPEFLLECSKAKIHGIAGVTIQITKDKKPLGEMVLLGKGGVGFAAMRDLINIVGHVSLDDEFNPNRGIELDELLSGKYAKQLTNCVMLDGFPGSVGDNLISLSGLDLNNVTEVKKWVDDPNNAIGKIKSQFKDGEYLAVQTPIRKSILAQVTSMPTIDEDFDDIEPGPVLEVTSCIAKDNRQLGLTKQWFKNYAESYFSNLKQSDEKTRAMTDADFDGRINSLINSRFEGMSLNNPHQTYKPSQAPFLGADYLTSRCATPKVFSDKPSSKMLKGGANLPPLRDVVAQAWQNFSMRLSEDDKKIYGEQVKLELSVIKANGFEEYFLNMVKVKMLAESLGNDGMLRGSAVASLILHMLKLSPVDPIPEGLLFERFMDLLRASAPDVDFELVDPEGMRQAAGTHFEPGQLAYLSSDNGISKPLKLLELARKAMIDFFPLSDSQKTRVEEAFKFLTDPLLKTENKKKKWTANINDWEEEFLKTYKKEDIPTIVAELINSAKDFSEPGLKSTLSSGSMVLIPEGVGVYFNQLSPYKDKVIHDGVYRIPQSKYNIVPTGHMKYDFLSNKSFSRGMNLWRSVGLPIDMELNKKDPAIGFVFKQDSYLGVNQVSGFVGNDLAKRFQPKNFNELTAIYALIRDGGNKELKPMIDQYIHFKNNPSEVNLHEALKPILAETYGSLLYEEQLIKLLTNIGGYDFGQADKFRSSLKKGDGSVIDSYEAGFIEHASKKFNVDSEVASSWYQHMRDKRGRYLFNKAHAVSYAHVGVRQCFSKVHYPAQYAAELFASIGVKFAGRKVDLQMIMADWANLCKSPAYKNPQNGMNFVDAVAAILLREEKNPNSGYDRRPGQLVSKVNDAIKDGFLDFILVEGQNRENLMKYSNVVFGGLEKRNYSPVNHDKVDEKRTKSPNSVSGPGASNNKRTNSSDSKPGVGQKKSGVVENPSGPSQNNTEGVPVNKKGGLIKWDSDVMIGHLLDFFQKEGVIKYLDVDITKAKALDHYRFQVTDKSGMDHNYHICGISTDPTRAAFRNIEHGLDTGLHQGSARNKSSTKTLRLAMELIDLTGAGDIKFKFLKDKKDKKAVWLPPKDAKHFEGALSKYVRACESPLFDINSSGILTTYMPCEPTSPVMGQLSRKSYDYGMKKASKLLQESRFISIDGMRDQFDNGNYSIAEVRSDKWSEPKFKNKGGRMLFTEVMANYQKVDSVTPIYELPTVDGVHIASGGHQRFMMDHKKNRASKMDQGFTTRRIRGHICGKTTKGSDTLWLSEAAMDALSFNELQDELKGMNASLPYAERNCVSVKNAGGGTDVISEMLGIEIMVSEKNEKHEPSSVDFYEVDRVIKVEPFTNNQKVSTKSWFEGKGSIHFLCENNEENIQTRQKLFQLMLEVGFSSDEIKSKIITHNADPSLSFNDNANKVFDGFSKENEMFLHQSNFDTWLRGSDMAYDQNEKSYSFGLAVKESIPLSKKYSEMSDPEKVEFANKMVKKFEYMSGAKSLGLALDNDTAGRQDAVTLHLFCKTIGLPIGSFMPKPVPSVKLETQNGQLDLSFKDHNDYLTSIKQYRNLGMTEEANNVLVSYSKFFIEPKVVTPKLAINNDIDKPDGGSVGRRR